jgi:tellurite resistance protein TehA-like permease
MENKKYLLKLKKIIFDFSFFIISAILVLASISFINKYFNKIDDVQERYKIYVEIGIFTGTFGLTLMVFFMNRLLKKMNK